MTGISFPRCFKVFQDTDGQVRHKYKMTLQSSKRAQKPYQPRTGKKKYTVLEDCIPGLQDDDDGAVVVDDGDPGESALRNVLRDGGADGAVDYDDDAPDEVAAAEIDDAPDEVAAAQIDQPIGDPLWMPFNSPGFVMLSDEPDLSMLYKVPPKPLDTAALRVTQGYIAEYAPPSANQWWEDTLTMIETEDRTTCEICHRLRTTLLQNSARKHDDPVRTKLKRKLRDQADK